jgi:hypothetical protein
MARLQANAERTAMASKNVVKTRRKSKAGFAALSAFLAASGRLPGFAQRRLDELIARKKAGSLTPSERRELAEALDYIDDKSIELMAYAAELERANAAVRPKSAGDADSNPAGSLWRRYLRSRLRQLSAG